MPKFIPVIFAEIIALLCSLPAWSHPVILDVDFKLMDCNLNPIPNIPVSLVFGSKKYWQHPGVGRRFNTNKNGESRFTARVELDKIWHKIPSNYLDNMSSFPHKVEHIMVGAVMEYTSKEAMYVVDIVSLPVWTSMQDKYWVYLADRKGNFTHPVSPQDYGKFRPDPVCVWTGWEPYNCILIKSKHNSDHWTLKVAFKRTPPPIPTPKPN